jgi:hypothetical protein
MCSLLPRLRVVNSKVLAQVVKPVGVAFRTIGQCLFAAPGQA